MPFEARVNLHADIGSQLSSADVNPLPGVFISQAIFLRQNHGLHATVSRCMDDLERPGSIQVGLWQWVLRFGGYVGGRMQVCGRDLLLFPYYLCGKC